MFTKYSEFTTSSKTDQKKEDSTKTITKIYGYEPQFDFDLSKPIMIPKRLVDVSRIKDELGWTAPHTLEKGLEKTIDWYKKNK